jgi:hypothetical protein
MTEVTVNRRRIGNAPASALGVERTDQVVIVGDAALLVRLREPLRRALSGRAAFYHVTVDWVGRCGEVMVSISGAKGRLPLLFDRQDLEPGYVSRVVRDAVEKYAP